MAKLDKQLEQEPVKIKNSQPGFFNETNRFREIVDRHVLLATTSQNKSQRENSQGVLFNFYMCGGSGHPIQAPQWINFCKKLVDERNPLDADLAIRTARFLVGDYSDPGAMKATAKDLDSSITPRTLAIEFLSSVMSSKHDLETQRQGLHLLSKWNVEKRIDCDSSLVDFFDQQVMKGSAMAALQLGWSHLDEKLQKRVGSVEVPSHGDKLTLKMCIVFPMSPMTGLEEAIPEKNNTKALEYFTQAVNLLPKQHGLAILIAKVISQQTGEPFKRSAPQLQQDEPLELARTATCGV